MSSCKSCGASGMPLTGGGYCGYCYGDASMIPQDHFEEQEQDEHE